MRQILVTQGQSIRDIAIQEYGCYEGLFLLIDDNPMLGLSSALTAGQTLNIRDEVPTITNDNKQIVDELKVNIIRINTQYKEDLVEDSFFSDFFDLDFYN